MSMSNLAMVAVGMNRPIKIEEERIWTRWLRSLCGDSIYLINIISCDKELPLYTPQDSIDHYEFFTNPGHVPGVCEGYTRGIQYLSRIGFNGSVIFTNPDVIPDERFKAFVDYTYNSSPKNYMYDLYGHDWGGIEYLATDFLFMPYHTWKRFSWPTMVGTEEGHPVMKDWHGNVFVAPKYSPALEAWAVHYIRSTGLNLHTVDGSKNVAWPPNVGVIMDIDGIKFNIIHSGGEARPTKKHLTNKYLSFDRDHGR